MNSSFTRWLVFACLGLVPGSLAAQPIANSAYDSIGIASLDTPRGPMTPSRTLAPGASSLAEIAPNTLVAGATAVLFALDVSPTITPLDPAVSELTVTLPPGYGAISVWSVSVGDVLLSANCPAPASGEYCTTVAGQLVTIALGDAVSASTTNIRIGLRADAPVSPGSADFVVAIVGPGGARVSIPGNADGDRADANSLTVTVVTDVDLALSTVIVNPPLVPADGIATSTITATLRNAANQPLAGRTITFASDRGAVDLFVQPAAPTDSNGVTSGTIRSTVQGISTITATNVTDFLSLTSTPQITFVDASEVQLQLTAGKPDAIMGEVVTYTAELRNRVPVDLMQVSLESSIPAGFHYLAGTARLNGAPVPDPVDLRTPTFIVGTVPTWVDQNGNGLVDPGEPGYAVVNYTLRVGSGASPGDYTNLAVARGPCLTCWLSSEVQATVTVRADELYSLGTIVGRVFEDSDGDGRQGSDEAGVGQATVGLDDGSYAITDRNGLYHFIAVRPGDRLVKIDLQSLGGPSRTTTGDARIIKVSPGLLAKSNFGVSIARDTVEIGHPEIPGLQIASETWRNPAVIVGTVEGATILVNGQRLDLPTSDVRMSLEHLGESVELTGESLEQPVEFHVETTMPAAVESWSLTILDSHGTEVRAVRGEGAPPEKVLWNGVRDDGASIEGSDIYQYQMRVAYRDGAIALSPVREIGVNRTTAVLLRITGEAFESGQATLLTPARQALQKVAELMRKFPDETIMIEGHTDSLGPARLNLQLSRDRAQAASDYLVEHESISRNRLAVRWYGGERPFASNQTEKGRELNRRVEVRSQHYKEEDARVRDHYRATRGARINGDSLVVDENGRFEGRVPVDTLRSLQIELRDGRGRTVQRTLPLPRLDILEPTGTTRVPFGAAAGAFRAERRANEPRGYTRLISQEVATDDQIEVYCMLRGRTDPGNTVQMRQQIIELDEEGFFNVEVGLRAGYNTVGLLATNPEGGSRLLNVVLRVSDEEDDGAGLVAVERVPALSVHLPPRGAKLTNPYFALSGSTEPSNRVLVNGQPVVVGARGRFTRIIELPEGTTRLIVEAIDPDGHVARIERELDRTSDRLFFMALADGVVGQLQSSGYIEGAEPLQDTGLYATGRVAYYLKGRVAGKYLITSAMNLEGGDFHRLVSDAGPEDNSRLITNLDPDRFYPVYGDSSTVVYDSHAQGRFYLAVDSDEFQAAVGNQALSLGDNELASFQRAVYGGRVRYNSVARSRYGDPQTVVTLLAAEARQMHVRDELGGTGGSLYYLSHREILEGSESVAIAVRDKNTGLVLARIPQLRNVDYTVKYHEGRILFSRPVSSVSDDGDILDPNVLPGHPVLVEVDYETRTLSVGQMTKGVRAQQQIGDHMALGGTYLEDDAGQGKYELSGTDVEFRLQQNSRLMGEYASSRGLGARVFASADGGVSFAETTPFGVREGDAWKAALDLDPGEWFGNPRRFRLAAYLKQVEDDFYSAGNIQDRGTRRYGLSGNAQVTRSDRVAFRFDREEQTDSLAAFSNGATDLASVRWGHERERWGAATGFESRGSRDGAGKLDQSSYGSASLWARPWEKLRGQLDYQGTIRGVQNDQIRAGLRYQLLRALGLEVRGTEGSSGRSLQGGAVMTVGDGSLYLNRRLENGMSGRNAATVLGAQAPIGPQSRAYTEYQWESAADGNRKISLLGLQRSWDRGPGLTLSLSGEHAEVEGQTAGSKRTSVAAGVTYAASSQFVAETRGELRFESGDLSRSHYLTATRIETRLARDIVALGVFRQGATRDRVSGTIVAEFVERSLGFAYRPVSGDRLNALVRYTRLADVRRAGAGDTVSTGGAMDVFTTEGTLSLVPSLGWSWKGATRTLSEKTVNGDVPGSRSYLVINRMNYAVNGPWGLGVEYRVLGLVQSNDQRRGWLNEVTLEAAKHVRVGLGFNFTDFSDNEFARNDYSSRGWFLRMQGRY